MQANITIIDFLILPFLLAAIYFFAYAYRNSHYTNNHPYRKYFIPALTVKIISAIFIGLFYEYYYGGGDTFNFFYHAKVINSSFSESPETWFNLLFHTKETASIEYYKYTDLLQWFYDPSSYFVCCIAAAIGLVFGTTYLPTAVMFAVLAFTGLWALFRTFAAFYPKLIRPVAIATLFIPSVAIWGSGIFKDTICMFALGWLTYGTFRMFVKRQFKMSTIIIVFLSLYLVYKIKLYILMAFIPALALWVLFTYTAVIKSRPLRIFVKLAAIVVLVAGSAGLFMYVGEEALGRYALSEIVDTAEVTREWIAYSSGDEGSKYDLGEISSPADMLLKAPAAINVTLFRPYLWESRKVIILLSALESFLFLILTLKVLFSVGLRRTWRTISSDPNIQFCLVFALIFAFAVGISTFNFGSLARYKIPCLPFYALGVLLTYYKNKPLSKPLFRLFGI